jgi:lipopolysaccharide/colanic/teichoic acid biosynthesis glycosyltransferase
MLSGEAITGDLVAGTHMRGDLALANPADLAIGRLAPIAAGRQAMLLPTAGVLEDTATPSWLYAVDAYHRALRRPLPIALDTLIAGLIVSAGTARAEAVLAGLGAFVVGGLLFGLWKSRSTVEAQGAMWYVKSLIPSMLAMGGVVGFFPGVTPTAAVQATISAFLLLIFVRVALWMTIGASRRRGRLLQSTLIVGPKKQVAMVEQRISMYPEAGLRCEATYNPLFGDGSTSLHGKSLVEDLLDQHQVEHVVCVAADVDEPIFADFVGFSEGRVDFTVVFPMARLTRSGRRIGDLVVFPVRMQPSWGTDAVKRIFDLVSATMLLAVLSPILLLIGAAIRLGDPGPALFKQKRTGRYSRMFTIYKFRSMVVDAPLQIDVGTEHIGSFCYKVFQDPRVTRVGALIRRFSLDELPQLLNVIKGEMSVVGPRPLAVDPDEFDPRGQIRHRVRPGITGLWQVSGANALTDVDMFELDLSYVVNHTLGMDILLILKTIPALIVRRALY